MEKRYFFLLSFLIGSLYAEQDPLESVPTPEEHLLSLLKEEGSSKASETIEEPDAGNWYEKLQWWKKAKPAYERVQQGITQLKALEKELSAQRDTFRKELEAFYASAQVQLKELEDAMQKALDALKTQQEAEPEVLTEEQRAKKVEIADRQKLLEQLKEDLDTVQSVSKGVEEAVSSIVPAQTKKAEQYEERALESFERIENVLDDQKAKQFYDTIENSGDNIEALVTYFRGPLRVYLDQSIAHLRQLLPKIRATIEELEKQGIILRKATEELKKKQELEQAQAAQVKKKVEEQHKKVSWWQGIWNSFVSFLSSLWGRITGLFGKAPQKAGEQPPASKAG
jgi:DNA repair exonuclease SbcCD ATPase subunit